jgi:hypothetical protein
MVCPVDENGYCSRHQKVHFGRLLEVSQMDNEFGEKHRQLWDRQMEQPSLLKKAVNFSRAVVRHAISGGATVNDANYEARLAVCAACEEYCDKSVEGWRCLHPDCGCRLHEGESMPGKARWATQDCPVKKWPLPVVTVEKAAGGGCGCGKE